MDAIESVSSQAESQRSRMILWVLLALFLLINIPPTASFNRYFGDEMFYSNGAIEMIQKHQYVMPMDGDGGFFYNKPALTFWLMVGSYKLFGVSPLSSRFPFLLVALITISLTYRLALSLFKRPDIALTSAAILAGDVMFIHESSFTITDALLTMGMLVSHYGYMQVLLNGKKTETNYACAYLGGCLGFGAKGFLGFMPSVVAWGFAGWCSIRSRSESDNENKPGIPALIHWPMMFLTASIIATWLISMWLIHGKDFTSVFFADQGMARLHDSLIYSNWYYYPYVYLENFFPWYIPLVVLSLYNRKALAASFKQYRDVFFYIFFWIVFINMFYLPGNLARGRYLLPSFPLFSIFVASWPLLSMDQEQATRIWRRVAIFQGIVIFIGGAFLALIGSPLDTTVVIGGLLLALAALVSLAAIWTNRLPAAFLMSTLVIVVLAIVDVFVLQTFNDLPSMRVADILNKQRAADAEVTVVGNYGNDFAPQLREAMGRLVKVSATNTDLANIKQPEVMVFTQFEQKDLKLTGYKIVPAGIGYRHKVHGRPDQLFVFKKYLTAFMNGQSREYLETCKVEFFVAIREGQVPVDKLTKS